MPATDKEICNNLRDNAMIVRVRTNDAGLAGYLDQLRATLRELDAALAKGSPMRGALSMRAMRQLGAIRAFGEQNHLPQIVADVDALGAMLANDLMHVRNLQQWGIASGTILGTGRDRKARPALIQQSGSDILYHPATVFSGQMPPRGKHVTIVYENPHRAVVHENYQAELQQQYLAGQRRAPLQIPGDPEDLGGQAG